MEKNCSNLEVCAANALPTPGNNHKRSLIQSNYPITVAFLLSQMLKNLFKEPADTLQTNDLSVKIYLQFHLIRFFILSQMVQFTTLSMLHCVHTCREEPD